MLSNKDISLEYKVLRIKINTKINKNYYNKY